MNAEPPITTNTITEAQWRCFKCLHPNRLASHTTMTGPWACGKCGQTEPARPETLGADGNIKACPVCGCPDLYRQRDFNRKIGIGIIVVGAVISIGAGVLISPWLTYILLTAFALVDFLIYRRVPECVVCYHCQAIFRGYPGTAEVETFDLNISDKYLEIERQRGW
jgi:ribosomal protein S27AE